MNLEDLGQYGLRPPRSDGAGTFGDVGFEQRYPSPYRAQAKDTSYTGRRSLEGVDLPRLLAAGEAQADARHSSPPLQIPIPPLHHWPPPQSMHLAHLARVSAGNVNTTNTPMHREAAARYPDGGGRGEVTGSWRANNQRDHRRASRSRSPRSSYPGVRPPRIGHSPSPGMEDSRVRELGSFIGGADSTERCGGRLDGEVGVRGAPPSGWRLQSTDKISCYQHPSTAIPSSSDNQRGGPASGYGFSMNDPSATRPLGSETGHQHSTRSRASPPPLPASSGGQDREDDQTLPSMLAQLHGGGLGRATSSPNIVAGGSIGIGAPLPSTYVRDQHYPSSPAEAPMATTSLSSPTTRHLRSGGRAGAEASPSQKGGGLTPVGMGRDRWQGGGDLCGGEGSCAESTYHRLCRGGRLMQDSPPRDQRHPHSLHPQDCREQGHHSRLRSTSPPADTIIQPPRLGRGISDPGVYGTAMPPLCSGVVEPVRSSCPFPGLADAVAAIGDGAVGGLRRCSFGKLQNDPGRYVGGGGESGEGAVDASSGAMTRWGCGEEQRILSTADGYVEDGRDQWAHGYNKSSEMPANFAKLRMVSGRIDTRHSMCKECTRQPSFGMEGDRRPSYCTRHKKAGMVNVSSRRCKQAACIRHPNFGFPGERRATYCKQHCEKGMIDIVSRRCRDPSCTRRPLYNMRGLRPVCCSKHKAAGMMDVVSARCQEPGCLRHPSFGYAADKKARRCAKHRLENMESVKGPRRQQHRAPPASLASSFSS